jgi:hypothetical protein
MHRPQARLAPPMMTLIKAVIEVRGEATVIYPHQRAICVSDFGPLALSLKPGLMRLDCLQLARDVAIAAKERTVTD